MSDSSLPLYETNCPGLNLLGRGKVRDIYDFGDRLLLVATDRLSAFDVIMPNPIPNKGHVLTYVSRHWFSRTRVIVDSHFISCDFNDFPKECEPYRDQLEGRSMLVRKTRPLTVECVARGYLHGSAVKEYKATGKVCGIELPPGLEMQSPLPEPIFTPTTKAASGHDESMTFDQVVAAVGEEMAHRLRDLTLRLYRFGHEAMQPLGITLVDTKFEFGQTDEGGLILIDECMTPDSSRYYETATYKPGVHSECYDKQPVRDYLESTGWNKQPPAPTLPPEIVESASRRYTALLDMLESGSRPAVAASAAPRVFTAVVSVMLKSGVFDVQGQTILQALGHMQHNNIRGLRAGKRFEVQIEAASAGAAQAQLEKISHDLLSNPVIEEFEVSISQ